VHRDVENINANMDKLNSTILATDDCAFVLSMSSFIQLVSEGLDSPSEITVY